MSYLPLDGYDAEDATPMVNIPSMVTVDSKICTLAADLAT